MKQLTLLLSLFFIVFTACQKTETEWAPNTTANKAATITPAHKGNIGPVPARFTQKVLLEGFTSANEGLSPMSNAKMDNLVLTSSGTIIGVNVHANDALASSMYNSLTDVFTSNYEIPNGLVNRGLDPFTSSYTYAPGDWTSAVNKEIQYTANCGLAIKAGTVGNTANIEVHAGFSDLITDDLTVTVYLIEHDMSGTGAGYDQANHFNQDNRSTFYNMGDPIIGYQHNHVLRNVLTGAFGDDISSHVQSPGGSEVFNFTANITGYDISKTHVVAFISEQTSGTSIGKILNVQSAQLNSMKNWD